MMIHTTSSFTILFGNEQCAVDQDSIPSFQKEPWNAARALLQARSIFFTHQVHSSHGLHIVAADDPDSVKKRDADYLITTVRGIGLAVLTADCLPIIMYDSLNHAIGIVHAGWRGSLSEVVLSAVHSMSLEFGTKTTALKIFFGPSAKACCYEIGPDLVKEVERCEIKYGEPFLVTHHDKTYLDVPALNDTQLKSVGIFAGSIDDRYNVCTMCNPHFCSYRKNNKSPQRQITAVTLK
jgi:polyphenol oxidase